MLLCGGDWRRSAVITAKSAIIRSCNCFSAKAQVVVIGINVLFNKLIRKFKKYK